MTTTFTAHNASGATIATVTGVRNAARLFVSCPDVFCLRTPGVLELDALYLIGQGIQRTYDNVVAHLTTDSEFDLLLPASERNSARLK